MIKVNNRLCQPPVADKELFRTFFTGLNAQWLRGYNIFF